MALADLTLAFALVQFAAPLQLEARLRNRSFAACSISTLNSSFSRICWSYNTAKFGIFNQRVRLHQLQTVHLDLSGAPEPFGVGDKGRAVFPAAEGMTAG